LPIFICVCSFEFAANLMVSLLYWLCYVI